MAGLGLANNLEMAVVQAAFSRRCHQIGRQQFDGQITLAEARELMQQAQAQRDAGLSGLTEVPVQPFCGTCHTVSSSPGRMHHHPLCPDRPWSVPRPRDGQVRGG